MSPPPSFEPTRQAVLDALRRLRPDAYARTRNHLDGAVTRLSPYLTHGLLDAATLWRHLRRRHGLRLHDKLVQEIGWREYFRHVWRDEGDGILRSLHAGVLPEHAYADALPDDVLQARSGVPVIDQAVRCLYRDGWLHNHARMWLASYLVHLRKVHWRAGADWMWAHLLDGDLASNHLSWQWVAGTASPKPYLFDAANVQRFAPPAWHSPRSVLGRSRDELEQLARSGRDVGPDASARGLQGVEPPACLARPAAEALPPQPDSVAGRAVWLMHPWALGDAPPGRLVIGVLDAEFHAARPWSAARWDFVLRRMRAACHQVWMAPARELELALRGAADVRSRADAHWRAPGPRVRVEPARLAFGEPGRRCRSFSSYWSRLGGRP